jgi:CDP-glucose 4,6-dehydratase
MEKGQSPLENILIMNQNKLFSNAFKGKKIIITGDTGFKGSWLSIWLNELGAKVYGFALAPQSPQENFIKTGLDKIISHTDGDVRNSKKLIQFFKFVQPDFAFHLAAQSLVLESYASPAETFSTNIMGTVNFLDAVKLTPSVQVAMNITSDKCYQNNEQLQGYRETDQMGGKDPYSSSKGCSELVTSAYAHSFFSHADSCKIASARAGNVIGGGDWAKNRVIPDFFRAVTAHKELTLRNPDSIRPWQHVLEPLSGYLTLCAQLYLKGNKFCGAWNFGPQKSTCSVSSLVKKIIEKYGSGSYTVENKSSKLHEANLLTLDITKAKRHLKWKPVLSLDEMVSFTVNGYQDELNKAGVYKRRVKQIEEYIQLAKKSKLNWVNGYE